MNKRQDLKDIRWDWVIKRFSKSKKPQFLSKLRFLGIKVSLYLVVEHYRHY